MSMGDIQWQRAECKDIADWDITYFPNPGRPKKEPPYKKYCDVCPILYSCLSYAIVHGEEGIWGGMTKKERDSLGPEVRDRLTVEAKEQGWFEARLNIDDLLAPQEEAEESPEIQVPDILPSWDLTPLEYFDLLESSEQPQQSQHVPQDLPQSAAQHLDFDSGPFSGPNESLPAPSPFDDTNLSSTLLLGTG